MRRKLTFGLAAVVVTMLAVSNPLVAEAARRITGADIRNGTITSRDINNKDLRSKDHAPQSVKSWMVKNDGLRSKDVKDGTLQAKDFRSGTLPVSAYGLVSTGANPTATQSKNVTSVTRTSTGVYCIELDNTVDRAVAVVASPVAGAATGNESAQPGGNCGTNGRTVHTYRQSVNAGALESNLVDNVSFNILVP